MKHANQSASPCELAYSIDDPPRPVSTPENNSMEGVYLTIDRNTQPGACIGCGAPHFSDHPTRKTRQHNNSDHGRTAPSPVPRSSLRRRSADTFLARKVARKLARKLARRNFQKSLKNTQSGTQNTLLFSEDPNVDSRSCLIFSPMARAARTEDQDEAVRSFDPRQTLDFPTQNPFLKLNFVRFTSTFRSADSPVRRPHQIARVAAAVCRWFPNSVTQFRYAKHKTDTYLTQKRQKIKRVSPPTVQVLPMSWTKCVTYVLTQPKKI
jgi:hypothetical protein